MPLAPELTARICAVLLFGAPAVCPGKRSIDPARIAAELKTISWERDIRALQIDYDACSSERPSYRALLNELRRSTRVPVGITALASWCDGDSWLNDRSLFEAVPMFFRMGPEGSKGMRVRVSGCSESIGVSTDEAWPAKRPEGLVRDARIYVLQSGFVDEAEVCGHCQKSEGVEIKSTGTGNLFFIN